MQNRNRILIAGALCGALALFSSSNVNAEGEAGLTMQGDAMPFHEHVAKMNRPSHTMASDLVVGAELPQGMTYWDIPPEYKAPQYRYTVVNGRAVVVDPKTNRVIEIMRR